MTRRASVPERSALDDAWADWMEGRTDAALGRALGILGADPGQVGAALLLAHGLSEAKRGKLAPTLTARLVDAFVRRGDLARALSAAQLGRSIGVDARPHHRAIAAAFGLGSKRVRDAAPAPPPLPPRDAAPSPLTGRALLDAIEAALRAFVASTDEHPATEPLPKLPLFGALPPAALEPLLAAWELRQVRGGDVVVREGAEGREAFVVVRGVLRAERAGPEGPVVLAVLGPGALFGEMALVSDAPRAASVVADEASLLLVVSRDALEKLAKKTPQIGEQLSSFCRARMVSNLIRLSPVLGAVAREERPALMARFETRTFKAGETLVARGAEAEGLFLIASGGVKVIGRDADGEELQIAALGPGDVVGEISVVLRRPATADVVATHPTVALELSRAGFQGAIKEHPTLLGELYELATKREEEMRSVVAQEALDVEEVVLL